MPKIFVANTKHGIRTHLTLDHTTTLCGHEVQRLLDLKTHEPMEIEAAAHWLYKDDMCEGCHIARERIHD